MAQFEARQRELYERFTGIQGKLPFEEVNRIIPALQEHARRRDELLVALAEAASDHDDEKRNDSFNNLIDTKGREVVDAIGKMLDSVREPTLTAMRFRDQAEYEEARFFNTLKAAKPAEARDTQMRMCHDLEWLAATLRVKWTNLSGTEKVLLEKERYYAGLMRDALKGAFEGMISQHLAAARAVVDVGSTIEQVKSQINDQCTAWVKEAIEKRGKNGELAAILVDQLKPGTQAARAVYALMAVLSPAVAAVTKGVGGLAKMLSPIVESQVQASANEIRYQQIGAQTVAIEFSETRRQADDYMRNSGYEQAKEQYARASSAMTGWAGDQNTVAQKSEAEAWVKWVDTGLCYFLELMRSTHAGLISEFEGIFMNGVSDKTVDVLTDRPFFMDWKDGIDRMDFDEKLKSIRAQVITLSGDIDNAFGKLSAFDNLPMEAQALIKSQVDIIREQVLLPFTKDMQEALRVMDAAQNRPVRDAAAGVLEQMGKMREILMRR